MPAISDEVSEQDTAGLLQAALQVVKDNFSAEHLPQSIHDFLLPISVATCQGLYATTMMMAAAMPALTNGASMELWSQRPSPLALLAIHVAKPQKGKSRLHNAIEMLFDPFHHELTLFSTDCLQTIVSALLDCQLLFHNVLLRKKQTLAFRTWPLSMAKP